MYFTDLKAYSHYKFTHLTCFVDIIITINFCDLMCKNLCMCRINVYAICGTWSLLTDCRWTIVIGKISLPAHLGIKGVVLRDYESV